MGFFFTADLHFFHKNVITYENRPFESVEDMNNALIKNWNKKVTPRDSVYILGDFSLGGPDQTLSVIRRLNGQLHLIRGNHDSIMDKKEIAKQFNFVKDYYELKQKRAGRRIVMFHYPINNWNAKHHGSIHLHGHSHFTKPEEQLVKEPNRINVGVGFHGYTPVSLEEIFAFTNKER